MNSHQLPRYVLQLSAPDAPGLVAAVSGALYQNTCNIEESAQFNEPLSGRFFMRVVYTPLYHGNEQDFAAAFEKLAAQHDMAWQIHALDQPVKTLIFVSQWDHCLNDLLYRWRTNHLNIDIAGVVSNHDKSADLVRSHGLDFHYVPSHDKQAQEEALAGLVKDTGSELIVLARYMQILSDDFCAQHTGRMINIHHSFLPGFKGAKPYTQAHARGVKIIGATAHYVTPDLDEGPIIAQNIEHVDHSYTPAGMQALGRDTEAKTLAEAVRLHSERRIFIEGNRTVIL